MVKMMQREIEKTAIRSWLVELSKVHPNDKNAKLWHYVYNLAIRPKRQRVAVNLTKIQKHANAGDTIVVPGKLLGAGSINKSINIAAIEYSKDAVQKLKKANCTILGINELIKKENVRIII
jgi:large subunit ribosomal protein L18e